MDSATVAQTKELFSYTAEEQSTFPYLRQYMERIADRIDQVLQSEEGRRRFMLAGLFLTYRAFNHQGTPFSTSAVERRSDMSIHEERLVTIHEITGEEIVDVTDYFRKLGMNCLFVLLPGMGRRLANFVLYG